MSDYKLAPVEPTQDMVEAAADAYMPFGDMELALRMAILAAPVVEAEPVVVPTGFRVMKPTGSAVREGERWEIYAPCGSGGIVHEDEVTDWVVRKLLDGLATAPQAAEQQPAPDVAGLTEALRQYQHNDGSDLVFGYDKLLVDQYVAQLVEALEALLEVRVVEADASYGLACGKAEHALAAHRKQGGGQ